MHCGWPQEGFSRAAPDHDEAAGARRFLELANVGPQLLGQIHLVLAGFHVGACELSHVVLVKHSLAWLDGLEERPNSIDECTVQHARVACRCIHVIGEDIPPRKHEVVQIGERHELFDFGRATVRALS